MNGNYPSPSPLPLSRNGRGVSTLLPSGEKGRDEGSAPLRILVDLLAALWLLFVFGLYLVRFSGEYAAANLARIAEFFR